MTRLSLLLVLGIFWACGGGSPEGGTTLTKAAGATPSTAGVASPTTAAGATPSTAGVASPTTAAGATPSTAGVAFPTTAAGATPSTAGVKPTTAAGATPSIPVPAANPTTAAKTSDLPTVTVGDASFTVELATTPQERSQGLSGRPNLAAGTGMLFVFKKEGSHAFWMKDMRFPLDMVWIDAQCVVVDITRNAPPPEPEQALSDLPTFGPSAPVVYVLEINAGESEAGIRPGSQAVFTGSLTGRFEC